jgi:hypothetical protein
MEKTRGFVIAFFGFRHWFGERDALIRANSRFLVLQHCKIQTVSGDSYASFGSAQNCPFLASRGAGGIRAGVLQ